MLLPKSFDWIFVTDKLIGNWNFGNWIVIYVSYRYVSVGDIAHVGIHPPHVAAIYRNSNLYFALPIGYDLVRFLNLNYQTMDGTSTALDNVVLSYSYLELALMPLASHKKNINVKLTHLSS